ncbi:Lacal_2735 family protein [Litoribacter ruber]|uniref:Lacal_2735 family protein n=1 Tax=Litoribacter ruber TaxID=702568 RepID=A0AAP2CHT7_9BACT|nr:MULTISPECIES: Lacal_2735 family protein [Litoribacter]MBS9524080.1 Lacal_2735 family protein [Litoribacter alkaliphilus]MBT0811336.1 Lacal_2735 family protein [Litoribacter ruber]
MLSIFKKKSKIEVLRQKHKSLLEEAFKLSKIDRQKSDEKYAEADAVASELESMKGKTN